MADRPPTILIVDDDRDIVAVLSMTLGRCGFATVRAFDCVGAVEAARGGGVDLVVSDLRMPSGDGLSLLSTLRGDASTRGIPFVLLTAVWLGASLGDGVDGPEAVLTKPFSPTALVDVVARLLAGERSLGVAA